MTTPKDFDNTVQATCPDCGKRHPIAKIVLPHGCIVEKAFCPECDTKRKRQEREALRCQKQQRLEAVWQSVCPPLYRMTDPARLPQDKLADVLSWEYGAKGLLLIGPTGGGKTRAGYLLLRRLLEEGRRIRAFDCVAFGHEVGRQFRGGTGEDFTDALAKAEIVFLDDVGKIPFTERAEAELFALIERRTANLLPIIATLNMTGENLEAKTSQDRGAPMVRRLREFCQTIVF